MAGTPFFRGPSQLDAYAAALVLSRLYQLDVNGALQSFNLIEPAESKFTFPSTEVIPSFAGFVSERFVIVAVTGTQTDTQAILDVVGSVQATVPPIPGNVGLFWGAAALEVWETIKVGLDAVIAGRDMVFLGHSLGGAICECMAALFRQTYPAVGLSVFTFGAPRPGDAGLAAAIGGQVQRFEDVGDPIVAVPPEQWASSGMQWPFSGPPPFATYVHPGTAYTIDENGIITPGSFPMDVITASVLLATGQVVPHAITEYARRLRITLPPDQLTPEVSDYDTPEGLDPTLNFVEGNTVASPGLVTASTVFYKVSVFYTYGESGPSEDYWTTTSPDVIKSTQLPAYLNARFGFAVDSFLFNYARISNPLAPRQVDFALPGDPGIPVGGVLLSAPAGNIKSKGVQGSADADALLFRLKLNSGPSAHMFLHGYDGSMDNQGTFTPNGTFIQAFGNFKTFLMAAGNNILHQFAVPVGLGGRKAITGITATPPRGATITPAAVDATLTPGTVVYIGGVGRSMQGVTGRKIITSVTVPPITAFNIGGASPVGVYGGAGGYYYVVTPSYQLMQYGGIERITEHKVGSPFGHPRGKRSARLSLRL